MLVIVSDLHLCDGTAYPQNVTTGSFALLLGDIYALAERYNAKSIDLVFLGDVFDMLRTERWFEDADKKPVPLSERPWGVPGALQGQTPPPAVLARARGIVQGIIDANHDVLAALRGEGDGMPKTSCPVRRLFLPGNHDRLYNFDPQIQELVRGALGAADETKLSAEGIFPHRLVMPRYGLLARHGHEWDMMNFQAFRPDAVADDYKDSDFLPTPIGDPITTELIARLPYELQRWLASDPAFRDAPAQLAVVRDHMEQIEDVRPLAAALHWVFYKTQSMAGELSPVQQKALQNGVTETVRRVAKEFLALPFFQEWFNSQHHSFHVDAAEQFKLVLELLQVVDIGNTGYITNEVAKLIDKAQDDGEDPQEALRDDLDQVAKKGLRFVVYGHTHEPLQVALRTTPTNEDIYLNSGTWRKRQFFAEDKKGFIGWEQFCYLVFYGADEALPGPHDGPSYECWMGSRRK